jgi:hypothetical protein
MSFLGQKRPGRGVHQPHLSRAEVKEGVQLYLYSLFWVFMAGSKLKEKSSFGFKSHCFMYFIDVLPSKRLAI